MDPTLQSSLAQLIVLMAGASMLWRLYTLALSPSAEVRCSRCPQPTPIRSPLPASAIRARALRVLSSAPIRRRDEHRDGDRAPRGG